MTNDTSEPSPADDLVALARTDRAALARLFDRYYRGCCVIYADLCRSATSIRRRE
jgi:hypothetical protein